MKSSAYFDSLIEKLANQNISKGIKPVLMGMVVLICLATAAIYYGLTYKYEMNPIKAENAGQPTTVYILDLLINSVPE